MSSRPLAKSSPNVDAINEIPDLFKAFADQFLVFVEAFAHKVQIFRTDKAFVQVRLELRLLLVLDTVNRVQHHGHHEWQPLDWNFFALA